MKIAVCDDCRKDAQDLADLLAGHEVRIYTCSEALLGDVQLKRVQYDLYFLDILMEGSMDGIKLAEIIRRNDAEAVICFVSTSDGFYREAYDLYAVQYLLKPVQEKDIKRLLERVSGSRARNNGQSLSFKWRGIQGSIAYGKIHYISSCGHTVSIHCVDGSVQEFIGKLNEIAGKICGEIFCRCHQSFIVNMYHVECMRGRELIIAGDSIPISRRYYEDIKNRYQEMLFEEVE